MEPEQRDPPPVPHPLHRVQEARPVSHVEALLNTDCTEAVEVTVRKLRLLFAAFVTRMGDERLPECVMLGTLKGGTRYRQGQVRDWVHFIDQGLDVFDMEKERMGGGEKRAPRKWTNCTKKGRKGWDGS